MKIAILQCDDVLDKFQPEFGNYPEMIRDMMLERDEGLAFDIFDVRKGRYPNTVNEYTCYMITGSKSSVYDGDAWIQTLIDFVYQLHTNKQKIFGICFGHQIIGKALDAKVEKSSKGWGVGVATNSIVNQPTWMEAEGDEFNLLVSHQDQVIDPPTSVSILARTDFCPNFMVLWSETTLSVQGHPEWVHGYSRALINNRRGVIPEDVIGRGIDSLSKPIHNSLFASWVLSFLNQNID